MRRRTLLQWIATAAATVRAWAQTTNFPGKHSATLRELAVIVLPSELGREGIDRIAGQFERWVREYRPGAEMDHGYGFPRLRIKAPSAASNYVAQLEAFARPITAKSIEAAFEQAGIKDLPRTPDGRHIAADLMSFYFQSSDANDLCYRAQIRRDSCRGLDGSQNPPPPLHGAA
jgi:hypothetical protein